ncbi:Oligoendopeptidase F [hydrothermal vent metagenome]|uniref:Oligoendopeptidase F n=1 Tax=hydrothermal vent metagenome TaxID=652676 RepID=A0A3B0T4Z8_9ZZZZ
MPVPKNKIDTDTLPEWKLEDLYPGPGSPEFLADLDGAAAASKAFRFSWAGRLDEVAASGGAALAKAVAEYEALSDRLGRIGSYAGLTYASNTASPDNAKFYGDTQGRLNEITTGLIFFELELNRIDDDVIEAALKDASLAHYAPWIADVRKERPYQLDDRTETLFHEKAMTGAGAWNRLFDQTMTALRFEIGGQSLALEPTLNLLSSPEEPKRKAGAMAIAKTLGDAIDTFALITNTLAKDKEISDRWRGFDDIAASRHLANRVEAEVVDALVAAVRAAYPRLSHRYYALKAKWMGMDKLNHWDRNAPLPDDDDRLIGWEEARETVLAAYGDFSPKMALVAGRFFDRGWIDAPVREGKSPGAFSHPTVPSAHPYVLLNYQGRPRDVMTLAHELGHGVHQVLAAPRGALMAPTPLTLAETASVFGEMLTYRSLLASARGKAARKAMIAGKVEDMLNTVVRQIAFYSFERQVHTERKSGELTAARIGEIWLEVQSESLGPAIRFGEGYEHFWSYVPHFIHSPFYVYAYAFGDCLVNSLYAVYENAETGFAEKYLELLAAGGTKHHSELLAPFGLDARDPEFWQAGIGLIDAMIGELEDMDG